MSNGKIKVLILTANPKNLPHINLEEEAREIDKEIRITDHRDNIELVYASAARPADLLRALNRHRPHVVHFMGHGTPTGEILLLAEDGASHAVPPRALKAVFEAVANDNIRLVFLNACYTRAQADAIVEVIECAVGTNARIEDRAAIAFAAAFYRAIGFARSVGEGVKQARAELIVSGIPGEDKVELVARHGVDAYHLRLIDPEAAQVDGAVEPLSEIDTDTTGRVFISSAPTQQTEARLIAAALKDRGIPLWEEALALDKQFIEERIKEVLYSPGTAGGLLALTQQAGDSSQVKEVELPRIIERAKRGRNFFVVAAKFRDFDSRQLNLPGRGLTFHSVNRKSAGPEEAAEIARLVLAQRIAAIHTSLPPDRPLRLELYTKTPPPFKAGTALLVDWNHRFTGRFAAAKDWDECLLPALRDIAHTIGAAAPGRVVEADGRPSLPALTALGACFLQPLDIKIGWWQHTPGRQDQLWTIDTPREPSGFTVQINAHRPEGADLAVLVSAVPSNNVEPAFESTPDLPPFRAIVRIWKAPPQEQELANAGQAAGLAWEVRNAIMEARMSHPRIRCVHLFMAAPAGLAMMVGQLLNRAGPVQTYEHEAGEGGDRYLPAALLPAVDR